jgi:hypothetical protein
MKRKLDPKKLTLDLNTITILTPDQFEMVMGGRGGGGGGDAKPVANVKSGRRC